MPYEVQTYTIYEGWVNCWYEDDKPQTFPTYEEAQAELDEFFTDIEDEIRSGLREEDQGYSRDEFQIVRIED